MKVSFFIDVFRKELISQRSQLVVTEILVTVMCRALVTVANVNG